MMYTMFVPLLLVAIFNLAGLAESTEGFANFSVTMKLYRDGSYMSPYTKVEFPVKALLNEPIYVEVELQSSDPRLLLFLDKCTGTPGEYTATPQYLFLNKGCKVDPELQYTYTLGKTQQFVFNMFRFTNGYHNLYIHCIAHICVNSTDSLCALGCGNRRRRDAVLPGVEMILPALGPVVIHQQKKAQPSSGRTLLLVPVIIGAVALVVIVTAVVAYRLKRMRRKNLTGSNKDSIETNNYHRSVNI